MTKSKPVILCSKCGEYKKEYARGICSNCYSFIQCCYRTLFSFMIGSFSITIRRVYKNRAEYNKWWHRTHRERRNAYSRARYHTYKKH